MLRLSAQFTAPALEWRVDRGRWPAIAERRDGQAIGILILAIAVAWLAVAARGLATGGATIAPLGVAGGWLGLGIGLALALWGCRALTRRQAIRIDHEAVHVRLAQLFWVTSWSEPLSHYRGVVWRNVPIRRHGARQIVHLIDLWHEDPGRTVTLFSSTDSCAAQDHWQAWARELGLAPLRWHATAPKTAPDAGGTKLAGSL